MRIRIFVPLVAVALAAAMPSRTAAQEAQLPTYTTQQRWARSDWMTTLMLVTALRTAREAGMSTEAFYRSVSDQFVPTWGAHRAAPPFDVFIAMRLNVLASPEGQVELLQRSDDAVTYRYKRGYARYFGPDHVMNGVKLGDVDGFYDFFGRAVGERLGLDYAEHMDGDWVVVTLKRVSAEKIAAARRARVLPDPAGAGALTGTWKGAMSCGQHPYDFTLELEGQPSGEVSGVFHGVEPAPEGETYRMSGGLNRDGVLRLEFVEVIHQPRGYTGMDLLGKTAVDGQSIRGTVLHPYCTEFEVHHM